MLVRRGSNHGLAFPALKAQGYDQASSGREALDGPAHVESRKGPSKIRQHAIRGRVQAGIFLGNRQAGKYVGFEINVR
jgi:hypothetical protein